MGAIYKAFVSSTYEDLKDHRAFVINSLRDGGIFVDPMENWTAESDEPKRFSTERLEGCSFCVLLVALRRGFIPSGETRSITQLEYQAALDRGMDVLVFLLNEDEPWPRRFDQLDDELLKWRSDLETRHGRSLFGTAPDSIKIAPALTRWVEKQKASEVGSDWVQIVSHVLGIPRNDPAIWKLATESLPIAITAIRAHYLGRANDAHDLPGTTPPPEVQPSKTVETLLQNTREFLNVSRTKYESTCFVLIPFGQKRVGNIDVDFDAIYSRIFVPAIQDVSLPEGGRLEAVRSDQDFFAGDISDEMFRYLEYSRVVLADTSGLNPNVMYELGARHRARETGTVVVRQLNAPIPFDINQVKTFPYEYEPEEKATESRAIITRVLKQAVVQNRPDSPVRKTLDNHC